MASTAQDWPNAFAGLLSTQARWSPWPFEEEEDDDDEGDDEGDDDDENYENEIKFVSQVNALNRACPTAIL